jgi:Fur family peroxide stress response transcriptional regulator
MIAPQARLENVTTRLREQGHRLTPQRMAVLKVLIGNKEHLSAEQIYERVRVDFPMTSLATIYKTVAVLKEMGEVLELGFSDDSNRYDGSSHPHPHLICVKCKKIADVDTADLSQLPEEIAQKTGYQIVSHRFDFFGVCPQCQENEPFEGGGVAPTR